jgi:hypothetical protein
MTRSLRTGSGARRTPQPNVSEVGFRSLRAFKRLSLSFSHLPAGMDRRVALRADDREQETIANKRRSRTRDDREQETIANKTGRPGPSDRRRSSRLSAPALQHVRGNGMALKQGTAGMRRAGLPRHKRGVDGRDCASGFGRAPASAQTAPGSRQPERPSQGDRLGAPHGSSAHALRR